MFKKLEKSLDKAACESAGSMFNLCIDHDFNPDIVNCALRECFDEGWGIGVIIGGVVSGAAIAIGALTVHLINVIRKHRKFQKEWPAKTLPKIQKLQADFDEFVKKREGARKNETDEQDKEDAK